MVGGGTEVLGGYGFGGASGDCLVLLWSGLRAGGCATGGEARGGQAGGLTGHLLIREGAELKRKGEGGALV